MKYTTAYEIVQFFFVLVRDPLAICDFCNYNIPLMYPPCKISANPDVFLSYFLWRILHSLENFTHLALLMHRYFTEILIN